MPILNADKAKQVYVVKRGQGKGYAGIVNALFYGDNCNMVYGDAAAVLTKMIEAVRGLGRESRRLTGATHANAEAQTNRQERTMTKKMQAACRRALRQAAGEHGGEMFRHPARARSWSRPRPVACATPTFMPRPATGR